MKAPSRLSSEFVIVSFFLFICLPTVALAQSNSNSSAPSPIAQETSPSAQSGTDSSSSHHPSNLTAADKTTDATTQDGDSATKEPAPSLWVISNQVALNTWLFYHPSPNSACKEDSFAGYSTNEISCDWRLQVVL